MLSIIRTRGLLGAFTVFVTAGPVAIRGTEVETYSVLDDRGIPSIALGSYDLVTTHQNDVLFDM